MPMPPFPRDLRNAAYRNGKPLFRVQIDAKHIPGDGLHTEVVRVGEPGEIAAFRALANGARIPLVTANNYGEEVEIWSAAFRYYCGRRTIAVWAFTRTLIREWPNIGEGVRAIIRRDLEREFECEDRARESRSDVRWLGDDCDRRAWEEVRALWGGEPPQTTAEQAAIELAEIDREMAALAAKRAELAAIIETEQEQVK